MLDQARQERVERQLQAQFEVMRVLAEATNLPEASRQILESICTTLDWAVGAMWSVDDRAGVLRHVEHWHMPGIDVQEFERVSVETALPPGIGLPGRVWAAEQPAWVADVTHDANFPRREVAAIAGLHGAVCFPIRRGRSVLGMMEFFSRDIRPPDEELLTMMRGIGGQIGQFIERVRAQDALRESEANKDAILKSALDCIVTMDHRGMVTEFNPAAEAAFGYSRHEAVGQSMCGLIIPPAFREAHQNGLQRYLSTGEMHVIGRRIVIAAMRKNGEEFPVELTITRNPGEPPVFTGFLRDLTERVRAEQERQELLVREHSARSAAEIANRAKDEFLAVLSHELRTPLTPVLLTASLLESFDLPDEVLALVRAIRRNVELEARLIDDLLDLTRITRGKLEFNFETVNVHSIIRSAAEICGQGTNVQTCLDLRAPNVHVRADPARLQQVLWNLLTNAHKFTPSVGQVTVNTTETETGCLRIEVSDTGLGIEPELLPKLFNAFEQGDRSMTRKFGGLGLGLAISKALVDAHGGTLSAHSAGKDRGATFAFELRTVAVPVEKHTDAEPGGNGPLQRPLKILLAEDHAPTLELLSLLMQKLGHMVMTASTVASAVQLVGRERFDLIISDVGLPDGSGYEVMAAAREQNGTRGIALSGYGMEEDIRKSMEAGFSRHLTKPVNVEQLKAAILEAVA